MLGGLRRSQSNGKYRGRSNGVVMRDGRRGGVTSDVVGAGSVGQVPDCPVGVLLAHAW